MFSYREPIKIILLILSYGINLDNKPILANHINMRINPHNNHRYFLTPKMSWEEAQNMAQEMGGYLVTINHSLENQWLVDNFTDEKTTFLWIGINDRHRENHFCWAGDEQPTYRNWATGEPNNNPQQGGEDLGVLNGSANPFARPVGSWSDAPKSVKLPGIVEIP